MARKRIPLTVAAEPLLMTRDEVKATLKIGDTMLYDLTNKRILKRKKIGKASRWLFSDVKKFAESSDV